MCKAVIKQKTINSFFNKKFILASSSVSRYKVLKNLNLSFKKINPKCDEDLFKKKLLFKKTSPKKISLELSRLKAKSISGLKKNILVLGADTTIDFEGRQIDKVKNVNEAKKKILKLSGSTHNIYSSASVYFNNKETWFKTEKTKIKIRKLSKKEIDEYFLLAGKGILNSVGCYEIEKLGPNIIEKIEGDFFNVMGLPLFPFLKFLKDQNN